MCGIAGITANYVTPTDVDRVHRMCLLMQHRGPDDIGIYQDTVCVLGQARLSIIDLAGGHQPLSNEDGTVWITFNGEIYNYLELRDDLIEKGHQFATMSDTEVIVHLYEEYGIDCVSRLNGMYAFALWDKRNRKFFLIRDRLGIKPVYYHISSRRNIIFASELKAILLHPAVSSEIDRDAIAEYMTLTYIPDPRTPFLAIRKLPGGCYLEVSGDRIGIHRYWSLPADPANGNRTPDDLADSMVSLIKDSVRLQLRADVPVGLFASGGLDSTAIMWAAAQQRVPVEAFLVEFDHLSLDTPYARLASESTGIKLTEKHLSSGQADSLLPKLVWHLDEPLADSAILPCYLIARHAAQRVKVILNGTGGDELFGGYHRYNVRGIFPGALGLGLSDLLFHAHAFHPHAGRLAGLLDYRQRYYRRICIFPEVQVRSALGLKDRGTVYDSVQNLFRQYSRFDQRASMMAVELHLYLAGDLFMMLDKMTMAASLEARVPLLDHRLVEFMFTVPGDTKMRNGELKWLLRYALRGRLPDRILDRPKQGFGPPVRQWMSDQLGVTARRLLDSKQSRVRQLFEKKIWEQWLENNGEVTAVAAGQIWTLLNLELWWRTFVDGEKIFDAGLSELALSA